MATTYLQAINTVLEKLGEDTVSAAATSITEKYEILVGSFINDIKEQIEDAHNWRALRQTFSVTIAADAASAVITGANERSRMVRIHQAEMGAPVALCFDVTDAVNPTPLVEMDLSELIYHDTMNTANNTDPQYFALDNSSGDVLNLYVWPRPAAETTISLTLIVPQAAFGHADVSEVIKIPVRPLIVGATWYALEERGEELGTNGMFNEKRFNDALATAISRDEAEQGDVMELVIV